MVKITINGTKKEREFQNMAQALAFAYQNGECYNAEKIELAYAASGAAVKEPEQKPEEKPGTPIGPEGTASGGAGVDNTDQAGKGGSGDPGPGEPGYIKTLEDMTHKELVAYAKELKINVGLFPKDADMIAAIRAEQKATATEPGATETPQNDNAAGTDATEPPKDGDGSANGTDSGTGEAVKEAGVDNTDQAV